MKTCLVQYDDRHTVLFEELMKYNRTYAARHSYEYIRPTQTYDIPPYWIKVRIIQQLLQERPDLEYIMWLDSDAVVHDRAKPIESLFETGGPDFLISYCPWNKNHTDHVLNVGVFVIRVTPQTKRLVNDWFACYKKERWTHTKGEWKTDGEWAGDDYEQGSFNTMILPKYEKIIGKHQSNVFDSFEVFPTNLTFSCHFCTPDTKFYHVTTYLLIQKFPELAFWILFGGCAYYLLRNKNIKALKCLV